MNHPTPEEWMPYLYGEGQAEARHQMKAHLRECPECLEQVTQWRGSLKQLDGWKLPRRTQLGGSPVPVFRLGFAAALLLITGFLAGSVFQMQSSRLRDGLKAELRKELRQELAGSVDEQLNTTAASTLKAGAAQAERIAVAYSRTLELQRTEDKRAVEAAIQRLEAQRVVDLATLKRELDTLAFNTDAGLRQTAQGLVRLATYSSPRNEAENKTRQ